MVTFVSSLCVVDSVSFAASGARPSARLITRREEDILGWTFAGATFAGVSLVGSGFAGSSPFPVDSRPAESRLATAAPASRLWEQNQARIAISSRREQKLG